MVTGTPSTAPGPLALPKSWRDEAKRYSADGALVPADKLLGRVAGELEFSWQSWWTEPLNITQAASTSGYTAAHLREMVRKGEVQHASPEAGPITIRRCDLPRKPGSLAGLGRMP